MKTYLDCIPCFFKQALDAARMAGVSEAKQKEILENVCSLIKKIPLSASPPEIGRDVYRLVREISGNNDPFDGIKKNSNKLALALYTKLKRKVNRSRDRLLTAVELAIAGNIIDYGVKNSIDIDKEIKEIFTQDARIIKKENKGLFEYREFKCALKKADVILYLADNAGEVVFDRILIEELVRKERKEVIYAVKEVPVINDALVGDAITCGIDKYAQIISSGSDAPGTVKKFCFPEFLKLYESSEMIISKGQGNFEALSEEDRPIFFLFRAKCPVVASHINAKLGDVILKKGVYKNDDQGKT